MVSAQPSGTPSDLELTQNVELAFSQDHIFQEMAQQLGFRTVLSPGVRSLSLRALVPHRPAIEVLRAARVLTGLQWCFRESPEEEKELYLWLPPDRLTETVILREEDKHRYAQHLKQTFEMVLHPPSEARREQLERYCAPTVSAAKWLATFSPEEQMEILCHGLKLQPFGDLPTVVQEALLKGFARCFGDPRTALQADGFPEDDPTKIKFVDPKIYLNDRTRIGLSFQGEGRRRWFHITFETPFDWTGKLRVDSAGKERYRKRNWGVGKLKWNRYPGDRIIMPKLVPRSFQAKGRLDQVVGLESLPDLLFWDSDETQASGLLRTRPEGMLRRFQWLSETSDLPFLIQLPIGETKVFPSGEDPLVLDTWHQLFDEITTRFGYTWTPHEAFFLWQHQDWYRYTDPTVPPEWIETWTKAALGNQGQLPLSELASLATASGDQLKWLHEQSKITVPEKLLTCGITRALLVFYATLSPTQRWQTESPVGLDIPTLTPAQVALLKFVPDLLYQTPEEAFDGTLQIEDRLQPEREIVFRFRCITGRAIEALLVFSGNLLLLAGV